MLGYIVISRHRQYDGGHCPRHAPGGLSRCDLLRAALHGADDGALSPSPGHAARLLRQFFPDLARRPLPAAPWFSGLLVRLLFFAASGRCRPFSGFWPKVVLVKSAIEAAPGGCRSVPSPVGFLPDHRLRAGFPVSLLAAEPNAIAADGGGPLAGRRGMPLYRSYTSLVVGFGILPEQLLEMAQAAASTGLVDPTAYNPSSVFSYNGWSSAMIATPASTCCSPSLGPPSPAAHRCEQSRLRLCPSGPFALSGRSRNPMAT